MRFTQFELLAIIDREIDLALFTFTTVGVADLSVLYALIDLYNLLGYNPLLLLALFVG
jgi:hypothetical protein